MKQKYIPLLSLLFCIAVDAVATATTQRRYLSGRGCDDMVQWEFYCTAGRRAGQWTTIGVPSCWEMQGFGTLQYGWWWNEWNPQPHTEAVASEQGLYRHRFSVPAEWKGQQVDIVFEAAMTDAEVKVNGRRAGDIHQGGFSSFRYDITPLLRYGKENLLEVTVAKESSNDRVNHAERRADYWNFGGIFRPVYLECKPRRQIERVAVSADMQGMILADVYTRGVKDGTVRLSVGGQELGAFPVDGDSTRIAAHLDSPRLWTAETPHLYTATFTLCDRRGHTLHRQSQRIGFRTVELRPKDGFYVNGVAVKMKGVNRHSFRPETGRTLSWAKNQEDVRLIKSMNMNAVRLSHYPADPAFYDLCDSLGLYVLDELTGWQHAHDTITGRQLAAELVKRDVNHPSILFWDSGNEGGFNYALEPVFHRHDPQGRMVIYPWSATREGLSTRHYRSYWETKRILDSGDVYMPTEFLHAAYDGGGGAGLYDYWTLMKRYRNSAGGFIWALVDEGVAVDDTIDCAGNLGPDGLVGPHHEREASYWTVRQLWSPIQVAACGARLIVRNEYDFRSLAGCHLAYRWLKMPAYGERDEQQVAQGTLPCPAIVPKDSAQLNLPTAASADVLEVTAIDHQGDSLFTWRFAHPFTPHPSPSTLHPSPKVYPPFTLHPSPFTNITFIAARRSDRPLAKGAKTNGKEAQRTKGYTVYADSAVAVRTLHNDSTTITEYRGGHLRRLAWNMQADGFVRLDYEYEMHGVVDLMGITLDYPEERVRRKRWVGDGPQRVWQNRLHGPQYGYWENDYNNAVPGQSFTYPEFKGYFAHVSWMQLDTDDGTIGLVNPDPAKYIGVYTPEDGIDHFLYDLPRTGIAVLDVIPAVRNKVDCSDLNGPSAAPCWADGIYQGTVYIKYKQR